MLTKEENESLTRVGPGTSAGEMLRRYWHPIAFVNELKARPLRRRILGKTLFSFATSKIGWDYWRCGARIAEHLWNLAI